MTRVGTVPVDRTCLNAAGNKELKDDFCHLGPAQGVSEVEGAARFCDDRVASPLCNLWP